MDEAWRSCVRCAWPHGKYQHSIYCLPEPEVRAVWTDMPEHAERVQYIELAISASGGLGRSKLPAARIVADYGI